ncbi:peptidoglycan -binding protein [Tistrella bauzanensis]|uniref:Peptidoglycan -binding protein n=1 Tax=Tistrella arctica TaxID=3133430 RepID=A0ABU9YIU6_9PROT
MRRLRRKQGGSDIWPGFVDALSSLLLVIIFLLVVFMLAQFYLSQALSGREEKLDQLTRQLNELTELLNLERAGSEELRVTLDRVSSDLERSTAERDSLAARVSAADQRITALEQALNEAAESQRTTEAERARIASALESAEADKRSLTDRMAELEERLRILDERLAASEQTADDRALALQSAGDRLADADRTIEAQSSSLMAALDRVDRQTVRAESAESRADAAESRLTDMAAQLERLNQELARLSALLDESRERSEEQKAVIADLGQKLNQALAAKVEELARYRSEFFGRLREVLGGREDIQIVGDRFVFQSEVLFDSGASEISPAGRTQLARLGDALNQIAGEIPDDINWVLQVDGHTDVRPISTAAFASNWELSAARAISVVKFLISQGVPPWRLAAAGYGEFHPIDTAETGDAYRRNRRIELKLTNK